jgi:hypothetical protein
MGINPISLENLVHNKPIPVEWDNEWWPSQKELATFIGCSTGRVNACLHLGHRLRGHYVTLSNP